MNGELLEIIYEFYISLFNVNNPVAFNLLNRGFHSAMAQNNEPFFKVFQASIGLTFDYVPSYFLSYLFTYITFFILILLLFKLFKWMFTLIFKLFRLN